MNVKHAILEQMGRLPLKVLCERLEIDGVDLRSVEAMRANVNRRAILTRQGV
jgi:hypothetical protein